MVFFFVTLPIVHLVVDKCGQLETLQKNDNATLFFVTTCLDMICFNDDEREKNVIPKSQTNPRTP